MPTSRLLFVLTFAACFGAAGTAWSADVPPDDGCHCRMTSPSSAGGTKGAAIVLLGVAAIARRRRRKVPR